MIYKQSSIDIIGNLVSALTFPVTIKTVINNGNGDHTLTVCDMHHAQPGFSVTIGSKKYIITDIIPAEHLICGQNTDDVIKVKGDTSNITATSFDLYKPFFFYGTPLAEGVELAQVNKAVEKVPMFWLRLDDFSEKFFENDLEQKERELKIRLYPLTQADHAKWLTSDAKKLAIDPMRRMAEILIRQIKAMPDRFDVDNLEWDVPAIFPKFGVISINRGVEKSLWHDQLSGLEMSINLTVFRKNICDKC